MAFVNLPPNLQDIFYSITDRISKLETGPNQAMYTAEAAQGTAAAASAQAANASAQALIAQTQATQALSQAQAAYVLGSQALIKDANTITNSGNNLTGINANGITVYSGASSSSGARVVMNSAGIAGYNSGGTATFSLLSSTGAFSTTGAVFTTSTISGGSLNINGNAVIDSSGFLTAQGATLKGTVNATAGYFGSPTNGWQVDATGLTGVGTGYISGGTITTTSGRIGGWYLGTDNLSSVSGSLSGYYMQTNGNASFATVNASGFQMNSAGALTMGTGTISGASTISATGTISTSGAMSAGTTITSTSAATATTSAATNCYITTGGVFTRTTNTSSQRYKENITDIKNVPELDPKLLLNLPVRAYTYKNGHIPEADDRADQILPGFIAEELDAVYPVAVDYENGKVETWNGFWLIPAMLSLIQDQEARIKKLEKSTTTE
jgi:hypothetical protein